MAKHEVGSHLMVTGDTYGMGHPFARSTRVSVLKVREYEDVDSPIYQCKATGQPGGPWWVHESDLMPEPPPPQMQPFGQPERPAESDPVHHPRHYMKHPSGVEIIDITRHHTFVIGNALKYIFRHEHKGQPVQDLKKAIAYLEFAIEDLEKEGK